MKHETVAIKASAYIVRHTSATFTYMTWGSIYVIFFKRGLIKSKLTSKIVNLYQLVNYIIPIN